METVEISPARHVWRVASSSRQVTFEDPLMYLPRKRVEGYAKGCTIYDVGRPSASLFVVILGRVKVASTAGDGCETVGRIVRAEGIFGESCLIGGLNRNETATALDNVTLMSWSSHEIEQQIEREPRLGMALSQYMVYQCLELQDRIESIATQSTPDRVTLALLQLAADLGAAMPEGTTRVASLPHRTIAEFVGTSREMVTWQMNRLRRLGLIRYSRKHIDVDVEAMRETLKQQGIVVRCAEGLVKRAGG
jgi:CRP/FNR family transcriptional regulator, cyclic AMP receptor protein